MSRSQTGLQVKGAAPPVLTALLAMLLAALLTLSLHPQSAAANNARPPTIRVEELVTGLSIPWDLTFTPDETMLFTQRGGVLSARPTDGTVQTVTADFSDLQPSGEGGLMGIVVDPNFNTNRRFYTCQTHKNPREVQVIAWTINADYTAATRVNDPLVGGIAGGGRHSGCRLRFGPDGYLWIATGDAAIGTHPQDRHSLGGKVLRVDASTGAGATGNPFASNANANAKRVYTYGHRNVQGLALRPGTTQMWAVEHGPTYDDEINLLTSGGNYGWDPVPGYNEGVSMTDLTKHPDAVAAKWSSGNPTLATSGGIFLEGSHWGDWEGRLAVAALKDSELHLFKFDEDGDLQNCLSVSKLDGTYGRLRTPMMGPDNALYVTTSNNSNDKILRVTPITQPRFNEGENARRSVREGTGSEVNVGAPISATDGDDDLTYTLSGPDADLFTIGRNGQIRTKAALTPGATYSVTISVTDGVDDDGNPDTSTDDTITVTISVTQPPPTPSTTQHGGGGGGLGFGPAPVAPKFTDGFRTQREVAENSQPGDAVGDAVDASHPDGLGITYSLSGANASLFTVDEDTGQIRVREGAALVLGKTYTINLTATDTSGTGAIIIVDIVVTEALYHEYDTNRNGRIDRDEVLEAVSDYFAGDIDKEEVIELVKLYYQDA